MLMNDETGKRERQRSSSCCDEEEDKWLGGKEGIAALFFRLSAQETVKEEEGLGGGSRHHMHCILLSENGPSKGMRMDQAQCEDRGGRGGRQSWARPSEKRRRKRENMREGELSHGC